MHRGGLGPKSLLAIRFVKATDTNLKNRNNLKKPRIL
jgi:hypothetical protein